jgi:hypothetical protein
MTTTLIEDWEWQALASEYLFGHVYDDSHLAGVNAQWLRDHVWDHVNELSNHSGTYRHLRVNWVPVQDDTPYVDVEHLNNCWREARELGRGALSVSDLHHDHPVFGREDNLRFRIWRDTAHVIHGLDFDVDSEVRLFGIQARDLDSRTVQALFCESIYQLAAFVALGEYPDAQRVRTPGPVGRRVLERLTAL